TDKLGKQNGGDIKANKKTYLLLKAQETATTTQHKEIEDLLHNDAENKVGAMLQLFTETGADKACRDAVEEYSQKAFNCLEDVAALKVRKTALHELATYLLQRDN